MAESLKSITMRALSWSLIESVGLQAVRFTIGIILARLLFPEQFGLIGMMTMFIAVAQAFLDGGFGAALIQKKEASRIDICSIFYFNIAMGITLTCLLSLVSPCVASFFNQPILTPLARVLSLTIVINSLGLIQSTILTKEINFKTQTKISLLASCLSGIVGVSMAVTGFGVWSLAFQQLSSAFFRTLFLWLLNSWRPTLIFSFISLRKMFSFGSRLLASGLLNQVFENIYLLAVGKLFSALDLGYFTRAKNFADLPTNTLSGMVGRVMFPVFSTIQDNPARVKRGLNKTLTTVVLLNFPMMIGLAVIARPLVIVLLTDKWIDCITYIQLLCILGLLYPLHVMNLNVLQALGRSELVLRLEVIKKILVILNIAITWRWGISFMICGMIVTSIISYYLNSYYNGILINYSIREQLLELAPYFLIAVLMGIAVFVVGLFTFPNLLSKLMAQLTIGILIYYFLCVWVRLPAFVEIRAGGLRKYFAFE